ncbi:MAG: DUF962 domain-containing protein [Pedobacter sp.]|jgi:hypothetical protein
MQEKRIATLKEFYPFYLKEHSNSTSRILHFIGTSLIILLIPVSIYLQDARFLILIPFVGYGFAWVGHFFFEKNKPATFKYPAYSLASDFILFWNLFRGKEKF